MGHYITYMSFPRKTTRTEIFAARARVIENDGERDGGVLLSSDNGFKLHDGRIFDTYDEAEAEINRLDKGWYDDHGVLYRDYSKVKPTKAMETVRAQIATTKDKRREYINSHQPNRVKAEFIGCHNCGSKIAKKYLRSSNCPICNHTLLPKSTQDRITAFDKKIKELENRYADAEKKQKEKAEVKWLVKLEFHV